MTLIITIITKERLNRLTRITTIMTATNMLMKMGNCRRTRCRTKPNNSYGKTREMETAKMREMKWTCRTKPPRLSLPN